MNKYLIMAAGVACLSATACSNDGYQNNGNMDTERTAQPREYADNGDHVEGKAHYWFDKIDRDHKGYITRTDMRKHADRLFHKMDKNGDGKVTFEEFEDFKQAEMEHHRAHHSNNDGNY